MQTIIYIMRHIDIGGHIDIPYKKIGITGAGNATLNSRLQQISNTKSPIKAQYVAAWEHKDARIVENALHALMEDSQVEGEWFLDKEDRLLDRMQPIMSLIGAKEIKIEKSSDAYSQSVLKKESEEKQKSEHILLGKISDLLIQPLRSTSRITGPTFFSINHELTYFITARKSGAHNFTVGRSKHIFVKMQNFLESQGYDVNENKNGHTRVLGVTNEQIVELINAIESDFTV